MSVLKRQREVRKQEKAALKREKREQRQGEEGEAVDSDVASADELAGYGVGPEADEDVGPSKSDA